MKRELIWAVWLIVTLLLCGLTIYLVLGQRSQEVLWDGTRDLKVQP
jgi:hypothetical protein